MALEDLVHVPDGDATVSRSSQCERDVIARDRRHAQDAVLVEARREHDFELPVTLVEQEAAHACVRTRSDDAVTRDVTRKAEARQRHAARFRFDVLFVRLAPGFASSVQLS